MKAQKDRMEMLLDAIYFQGGKDGDHHGSKASHISIPTVSDSYSQ